MSGGRVLVSFSCGAASAVALSIAVGKYGAHRVKPIYCDTLKYEHPDNRRFMRDVEAWCGVKVEILHSPFYRDIFDVFDRSGYLVGPNGAKCTKVLKRDVRVDYQQPGDIHVFGLTVDETMPLCRREEDDRIARLEEANPGLVIDWVLRDYNCRKADCFRILREAGIELPMMYRLGYTNNNCIGCVKGGAGYWNKIRRDFPDAFARMAAQERKMGRTICKVMTDGVRRRVYLDELPPDVGDYGSEPSIECGPQCVMPERGGEE